MNSIPQPDPDWDLVTGAGNEAEKIPNGLTRICTEDIVYPSGLKLVLLVFSLFVTMFLVALVGDNIHNTCSALRLTC